MRLLALGMFPIRPPSFGGAIRVLSLLRQLAESGVPTDYIYPLIESGEEREECVAPGISQRGVPVEGVFLVELQSREAKSCVDLRDILLAKHAERQVHLRERIATALQNADRILCIQPYLYPFVRESRLPVFLDCHDVEADVKRTTLESDPFGEPEQRFLEELEREVLLHASAVFVVSREDAARVSCLYSAAAGHIRLLPNGAGPALPCRPTPAERRNAKYRLRLNPAQPTALFLSSSHPPNVRTAHAILNRAAPYLPGVTFLFAGTICCAIQNRMLPSNAVLIPEVNTQNRELIYAASDAALNPCFENLPGSDLKVLDYLAAGVPVVATARGARGHDLAAGWHYLPIEEDLPAAILRVVRDEQLQGHLSHHGLEKARSLSWDRIAPTLLAALSKTTRREIRVKFAPSSSLPLHENRREHNRKHALAEFRFNTPCVQSTPVQVVIELTNDCHSRCLHCFRSYEKITPSYISPAVLTRIPSHFLDNAEQIDLSNNGESMIHPAWDRMLDAMADSGRRHVTFNTSLTPATPSRLRRMVELGCGVTVSMDGATKETYERIRRGASYDHTLQSLRLLKQYADEIAHPEFSLSVNWVLYEQNLGELVDFARMAPDLGIAAINLLALAPHHEAIKAYCADPANPATEERLLRALHAATESNVILNPPHHLIRSESMKAAVERNQTICATVKPASCFWHHHPDAHGCSFPWTQLNIDTVGRVVGCCFSDPVMGNLMITDLEEIWNNHRFAEWRAEVNQGKVHKLCVESNCGGHCCPRVQYLKHDDRKSHYLQ